MREQHDPYLADLRGQLVGGIARRRRRRRRAGAGGLLAAAATAVVLPLSLGGAGAALAVERHGDWIELRIADATAEPAELTRELREAGIDGEVHLVPVEPGAAGRWLAAAEHPDDACASDRAGADGRLSAEEQARELVSRHDPRLGEMELSETTLRIRADFARRRHDGFFSLIAGRAAEPGEEAMDARGAVRRARVLRCQDG